MTNNAFLKLKFFSSFRKLHLGNYLFNSHMFEYSSSLLFVYFNSFMTEVPIIQKPVDLLCKSMDWFLYDSGWCHERVNFKKSCVAFLVQICTLFFSVGPDDSLASMKPPPADLSYYNHLMSHVPIDYESIPLIMDCLLEQV